MEYDCPEPPLRKGQTYPGEITRDEAARLTQSSQFVIPGLKGWRDYKPLLITHDELRFLDGIEGLPLGDLEIFELMPSLFSVTHRDDGIVYSCHQIELWRRMLPVQLRRLEAINLRQSLA